MLKLVKYQQFILGLLASFVFLLIGTAIMAISFFSANRQQTGVGIQEISSATTSLPDLSFTVAKVIDGDTIKLENGDTIRYIGINAPEMPAKCFAQEATNYNNQLVVGKTVTLEKDVSETDKYGRLLRYVYVNGEMINEKLIRDGYAQISTYPPDVKYVELFKAAQADARLNQRGLWSKCNVK